MVHQKRDFKAHPAASSRLRNKRPDLSGTTLLVGSFQLAADSRLSTHSPSTLDLGSLSTHETRDPATACVDSEASSSTVALGKALSVVATKRFVVCDPHASSFLILRSGTRDPHQSPSSTRAPSPGQHPRSRANLRVRLTDTDCLPQLLARGCTVAGDGRFAYTQKMFHRSFSPRSNCCN